jgi:UrcA family protein
MSRLLLLGAVALASTALPLAPVAAQSGDYGYDSSSSAIIVTGPHSRRVGRSSSGAPIIEREAVMTVDYSDLDLSTAMDRDRLYMRVDAAARNACDELDDAFGVADPALSEPADCRADAVHRARGQVRDAIERARYYRNYRY